MNKSSNIISFYLFANKLKEKVRTGHIEMGIDKERLESVAEHIYGCLILAIAIDSEYKLDLDMYKVLKMLTLHELEEILMGDLTIQSDISFEDKKIFGMKCAKKVMMSLSKKEEIENILNEFNAKETKEAIFCYHIDKIEADFQAKVYDLQGAFSYEKAKEDLPFYGDRAHEIEKNSKTASDFWIEWDKPKYDNDEIFKELINAIQNIEELK